MAGTGLQPGKFASTCVPPSIISEANKSREVGSYMARVERDKEVRRRPRRRPHIEVVDITEEDRPILDHWNSMKIMRHKDTKIGLHDAISFALDTFTEEEIMAAIERYGTMYHDESYKYCAYKWALTTFLTHTNAIPEFLDDGTKWNNYLKFKEHKPNNQQKQLGKPEPKQKLPIQAISMACIELA